MGYQEIEIPTGYSLFCVTFEGMKGTGYDCKNIEVLNSEGLLMNDDKTVTPSRQSRNKVMFQKLNLSTGNLASTLYRFSSQNNKGWCEGSTSLMDGALTFASGEAIYIQNNQGEKVKFRCRGNVQFKPVSMALEIGYSIVGNMTPVEIDVSDIKLLNSEGLEMNDDKTVTPSRQSRNKVIFQKLNPETGNLLPTLYRYSSQNKKGWCEGSTALTKGALTLKPGESFYLQNTQGDCVYLQFPSAVSE